MRCVWRILVFLQTASDSECWRSSVESGLTGSPERRAPPPGQNNTNGQSYRWVCCPFSVFLAQHYSSWDLPQQFYINKRFEDPGATFHARCGMAHLKCKGPQDPVLSSMSQAVTRLWKASELERDRRNLGWERGIEPWVCIATGQSLSWESNNC